ncbi:hypothetical protein Tco_0689027, partial [Tanacetum coccineum]
MTEATSKGSIGGRGAALSAKTICFPLLVPPFEACEACVPTSAATTFEVDFL